jgi:hypothetical protein
LDGAAGAGAQAAQLGRQQAVGNFRGYVLENVIARGLGEGRGGVAGIGDVAAQLVDGALLPAGNAAQRVPCRGLDVKGGGTARATGAVVGPVLKKRKYG